jgi:prepilin-type N-terminal cleavage/methylation domain-containing protein
MVAAVIHNRTVKRSQRGFSLVEVMISTAIVTIGMMAVVGSFGAAIASTQSAQEDLIAKQKALEAVESIFTSRNTQQIVFAQIANVSSGGIFKDGYQPLLSSGLDGLVGTVDDANFPGCPGGVECLMLPGADGILGTADDVQMSLGNFSRQILIVSVLQPDGTPNPNLKQITVNVQYSKPGLPQPRVYTTNAMISAFR